MTYRSRVWLARDAVPCSLARAGEQVAKVGFSVTLIHGGAMLRIIRRG